MARQPRPANQDARNASADGGKRRVQLTWRAREATPRSYRPGRLYLHRLSPLHVPPSVHQTVVSTPHPPTPPGAGSLLLSPLPSLSPATPAPPLPPLPTPPRPSRRCLPPAWPTPVPTPPSSTESRCP
jgi:hypothetical protein